MCAHVEDYDVREVAHQPKNIEHVQRKNVSNNRNFLISFQVIMKIYGIKLTKLLLCLLSFYLIISVTFYLKQRKLSIDISKYIPDTSKKYHDFRKLKEKHIIKQIIDYNNP